MSSQLQAKPGSPHGRTGISDKGFGDKNFGEQGFGEQGFGERGSLHFDAVIEDSTAIDLFATNPNFAIGMIDRNSCN
jgi:hypothetical protein